MPYFTTSKGIKLHYSQYGESGPALVFLHGWGMNSNIWKYQTGAFRKHLFLALDLRGHGRSDKSPRQKYRFDDFVEDLREFIPALNLKQVILVGWSMGGYIAIKYLLQNRERIKSLVLVGAAPRLTATPDFPYGQPEVTVKRLRNNLRRSYQKQIKESCQKFFNSFEPLGEGELKKIRQISLEDNFFPPPSYVSLNTLRCLQKEDLRKDLAGISVPTLILHGAEDNIVPLEVARYLSFQIPVNKLVIFPGAGHAVFLVRPEEFNRELKIWIKERDKD